MNKPKFEKDREAGLVTKSVHPDGEAIRKERMVDYALVPLAGISRIAKRYMLGDIRYGRDNWKKGGDEFLYDSINHAFEHLYKFAAGDTSQDHIGALGWFITMIAWHEENGTFPGAKALYGRVGDMRKLKAKMIKEV